MNEDRKARTLAALADYLRGRGEGLRRHPKKGDGKGNAAGGRPRSRPGARSLVLARLVWPGSQPPAASGGRPRRHRGNRGLGADRDRRTCRHRRLDVARGTVDGGNWAGAGFCA